MNKYYTVGIVEDEVIERQALQLILIQNRPILQIVFEAEDGNSALELVHRYTPDILIVDIQIPERSGLELCQELRQEGYAGLIIISTSYSLFNYAYLAIKLNVLDYLLKPTSETQILSVLDRCVSILEKDEQRKEKEQRLEEHMCQARYEADRRSIHHVLSGNEQILPKLREVGLPQDGEWQAVWIAQALDISEDTGTREAFSLHSSVCRIFQRAFFVFARIEKDRLLLFIHPQETKELFQLYSMLRCYIWSLKQLTGQKQPCYVGPVCISLEEMQAAGRQIPEELYSLQMTSRDFIGYTCFDRCPRAFSKDKYVFHMHKILRLLQDNRMKYLESMILSELREYAERAPQKFWEYIRIFVDAVLSFSDSWDLSRVQEEINHTELLKNPEKQQEIIHQILSFRPTVNEEGADASIDKILRIMRTEYSSDLSQAAIAHRMGMTQTYFSRIFKNKTGKTFVSVLTEIRMNRAKELIAENRGITIGELTALCGYTSKTYFCSLFRKTTGLTVYEYQRRIEDEE